MVSPVLEAEPEPPVEEVETTGKDAEEDEAAVADADDVKDNWDDEDRDDDDDGVKDNWYDESDEDKAEEG